MDKTRSARFSSADCALSIKFMINKIKELRAKYNLTQEELAKRAGVRRETIVFLEQGKYNPSLKLAHDVAIALQSTIEELFLFDEKKL